MQVMYGQVLELVLGPYRTQDAPQFASDEARRQAWDDPAVREAVEMEAARLQNKSPELPDHPWAWREFSDEPAAVEWRAARDAERQQQAKARQRSAARRAKREAAGGAWHDDYTD